MVILDIQCIPDSENWLKFRIYSVKKKEDISFILGLMWIFCSIIKFQKKSCLFLKLMASDITNKIRSKLNMMILRTGYCNQTIFQFSDSRLMSQMKKRD